MERCWCEHADTQSLRGPWGTPVPETHCTCLVQEAGTIDGPARGSIPEVQEGQSPPSLQQLPRGGLELFSHGVKHPSKAALTVAPYCFLLP